MRESAPLNRSSPRDSKPNQFSLDTSMSPYLHCNTQISSWLPPSIRLNSVNSNTSKSLSKIKNVYKLSQTTREKSLIGNGKKLWKKSLKKKKNWSLSDSLKKSRCKNLKSPCSRGCRKPRNKKSIFRHQRTSKCGWSRRLINCVIKSWPRISIKSRWTANNKSDSSWTNMNKSPANCKVS